MTIRRSPMFVYSNQATSGMAGSWARERARSAARSLVVRVERPTSTRPAGIRAVTVRRAGTRRTTPLVRVWRR